MLRVVLNDVKLTNNKLTRTCSTLAMSPGSGPPPLNPESLLTPPHMRSLMPGFHTPAHLTQTSMRPVRLLRTHLRLRSRPVKPPATTSTS